MMYKIMSNVCARMDDDGNILSATQTLLKSNIMHASTFIPKKLHNKIDGYDLNIDRSSVYQKNGVCRGDIYVTTTSILNTNEQRMLIDSLMKIGNASHYAIMQPVVIRSAPNKEHVSVLQDLNKNQITKNDSAFILAHTNVQVSEKDIPKSYRNSDVVIRSLNSFVHSMGLKTVFSDGSVYDTDTDTRNYYVLFQKTSRFQPDRFSYDELTRSIRDGFSLDKMHPDCKIQINMLPVLNKRGIVGSVALENAQIGNKYLQDHMSSLSDDFDTHCFLSRAKRNPLFVNGVSGTHDDSFVKTMFPVDASMKEIKGSTSQELSPKWQTSDMIVLNAVSDDKNTFKEMHKGINDILADTNELLGCDESKPVVLNVFTNPIGSYQMRPTESIYLDTDPDSEFGKQEIIDSFLGAVSGYSKLNEIEIKPSGAPPLIADISSSRKISHISTIVTRERIEQPKDESFSSDFVLEPDHEKQIDFT